MYPFNVQHQQIIQHFMVSLKSTLTKQFGWIIYCSNLSTNERQTTGKHCIKLIHVNQIASNGNDYTSYACLSKHTANRSENSTDAKNVKATYDSPKISIKWRFEQSPVALTI